MVRKKEGERSSSSPAIGCTLAATTSSPTCSSQMQRLSSPAFAITAATAAALDARLFALYPLPQLMEAAGHAVAAACSLSFPLATHPTCAVLVGPGNNGGDGLVAARHLAAFGYRATVISPRPPPPGSHNAALHAQLAALGVPVAELPASEAELRGFSFLVDAVFGFSFRGPLIKPPFAALLAAAAACGAPILSVDVPSGWAVDEATPPPLPSLRPTVLLSLTFPKPCATGFETTCSGAHWVGLRGVVPPALAAELGLPELPWAEAGAAPVLRLR